MMKVLVVEDEARIRRGIVNLLERIGHGIDEVLVAENGIEGKEAIKTYGPDIVITDIKMPELTGLDMIKTFDESGKKPEFIILSGYSDFEYAKAAIHLNVVEYLLKPVVREDIIFAIEKARKRIERSSAAGTDINLPLEFLNCSKEDQHFREYLDRFTEYIEKAGISAMERLILFSVYSEDLRSRSAELREKLDNVFNQPYIIIPGTNDDLLVLFNRKKNSTYYTERFEKTILPWLKRTSRCLCAYDICDEIITVPCSFSRMHDLFEWSLVSDDISLLGRDEIEKRKTRDIEYPRNTENKMKSAIYDMDFQRSADLMKDFSVLVLEQPDIHPRQLKQFCARFIITIASSIQEVDTPLFMELNKKTYPTRVINAVFKQDLVDVFMSLIRLFESRKGNTGSHSSHISRTLKYIETRHSESISLDSCAEKLGLSTSYLSSLFKKETGQNFSDYLREYRIGKAKKLLQEGSLTVNKIAGLVGYRDPKYFSKAFKDTVGISPGEFRKTSRS